MSEKEKRQLPPSVWYRGKRFYGHTLAEAEEKRDLYRYESERGIEQIRPITVEEFIDEWFPAAKASVEKKTYKDYKKQLDLLKDCIGNRQLSTITALDIKKVWQHYVGYSNSTIKRTKQLFNSMFVSAMESGYIKTNPIKAESAQPHKGSEGTHRQLEDWEIEIIETFPHRLQPALMLMLYAGLRRGEVLALTNKDIKGKFINVTKAVRFDGNKAVITDPKTEAGVRKIPLLNRLKPCLKGIKGYYITDSKGNVCSQMAFKRVWQDYKDAVERKINGCTGQKRWYWISEDYRHLDPQKFDKIAKLLAQDKRAEADMIRFKNWKEWTVRPHDLRHTYATFLRDNGIDLKLAMQWLGHEDEKMLLRIYDHVTDRRIQSAINVLNKK